MLAMVLFTGVTTGWVLLATLPIIAGLVAIREFALALIKQLKHMETRGELNKKQTNKQTKTHQVTTHYVIQIRNL